MTHAVEHMAYANQVPWHGLGFPVASNLSAMEMRKAAKQDYKVHKVPVHVTWEGKSVPILGKYALIRDSDGKHLSMVGSVYRPVQTEQVFQFFHDFVKQAKMKMETAGSLWGGKYVWALARVVGNDFEIGVGKGKKDEMRNYLLLLAPFEHGKALIMQYTSVRVVCWNTLCMAIGANLKGKGHAFRMAHTKDFEVEKEEAKRVLGLITDQAKEFKEASAYLARKKVAKEMVDKFFADIAKQTEESKKTPSIIPKLRAALEQAPGQDLVSAKGTWWGALNAVTYVIDHELGKSRDTALKNAWIGNHSNTKRHALSLALEGAK